MSFHSVTDQWRRRRGEFKVDDRGGEQEKRISRTLRANQKKKGTNLIMVLYFCQQFQFCYFSLLFILGLLREADQHEAIMRIRNAAEFRHISALKENSFLSSENTLIYIANG